MLSSLNQLVSLFRGSIRRIARRAFNHTAAKPQQLEMLWTSGQPPAPVIPEGFTLTSFTERHRSAFLELMESAFVHPHALDYWLDRVLPDGFFLVTHDASGELAATCMASHHPAPKHPYAGNLGWLATHPRYRGQGLGRAVSSAVTNRLVRGGYKRIYLETDDFRHTAISIYLDLGWVPYLFSDDMTERWRRVYSELGLDFDMAVLKDNVLVDGPE